MFSESANQISVKEERNYEVWECGSSYNMKNGPEERLQNILYSIEDI